MPVSVILPSRTFSEGVRAVRRLPAGADEVVLVTNPVGVPGVHPGHLRNRGAARAGGDVLVFVDDDVRLRGDLGWFQGRPGSETAWSASSWVDVSPGGRSAVVCWAMTAMGGLGMAGGFMVGAFQPIRRSVFERLGGYRTRGMYSEDQDLGARYQRLGLRPAVGPFRVECLKPLALPGEVLGRAAQWWRFPAVEPEVRVFRPSAGRGGGV